MLLYLGSLVIFLGGTPASLWGTSGFCPPRRGELRAWCSLALLRTRARQSERLRWSRDGRE
eukprot:13412494-Alexandrium_andersonii.AAC.1